MIVFIKTLVPLDKKQEVVMTKSDGDNGHCIKKSKFATVSRFTNRVVKTFRDLKLISRQSPVIIYHMNIP